MWHADEETLFTDNKEQSFAPPNFKFKFNLTDFKEGADDSRIQKFVSIPKRRDMSQC